jgi:hypothetical protein
MYYKEWLLVRKSLFWFAVLVPASWLTYAFVAFATHTTNDLVLDSWKQLLSWAVTLGAVAATIFGSSLARENGHLELACTKPVSRFRYALGTQLVDMLGIAAVFAIVVIAVYVTLSLLAGHPLRLAAGTDSAWQLVRYCAAPLAWFGLMTALTARLRCQAAQLVMGLSWPAAVIIVVLAAVPLPPVMHNVFAFINLFNPIAASTIVQIDIADSGVHAAAVQAAASFGLNSLVLGLFALGGPVAAALQWRRVEA